jgi:hypothetical protein
MATYANLRSSVHTVIYGILTADTTLTALTNNIVDGSLYKVVQQRGFPYVLIKTPTVEEHRNRSTDNSVFHQEITIRISVASIKESVVRSVADAVINALETNQVTTRAAGLNWYKLRGASQREYMMDNQDTVHVYDIDVGYTFIS